MFAARRADTGQELALKVLLDNDRELVRRFRQEGQVLARLSHPNLVAAFDLGEARGRHYLAIELIDGMDLRGLVRRDGPPDLDWICETLSKIADALSAAHDRGLVHRDVKPANIMIESGTGRPVLVDFGLVKRDPQRFGALSQDQLSQLTASGVIMGTPGFMAPEQADSFFGPVGPSADVYGLGAVLFYLLTGSPPYHGTTSINILTKLLGEGPPPTPMEVNAGVPEPVARLCQRALSKQQRDRPESPRAFVDELRLLVDEQHSSPPARRRMPSAPLFGAASVVAVLAIGIVLGGMIGDSQPVNAPVEVLAESGLSEGQLEKLLVRAKELEIGGDPAPAIALLLPPAEGGHTSAMVALAHCYTGKGQDHSQAVRWYQRAAQAGDTKGMIGLAVLLTGGIGTEPDPKQARAWWRRAADAGDPEGMVGYGIVCLPTNPAKATNLFKKSAKAGSPEGMFSYGTSLGSGRGVPEDLVGAAYWIKKAADLGHVQAMATYAVLLEHGRGVEIDLVASAAWNRKAAEAGSALAMARLGIALWRGQGVDKDSVAAARWLRQGAEGGDALAMYGLGLALTRDEGPGKDLAEARKWLRLARDEGNARIQRAARKLLQDIENADAGGR